MERQKKRTSSLRELPSAFLHHCRSALPSSTPGCPLLDTLNWISVRCAASPWVSFPRVTELAACVHMYVYVFDFACKYNKTKQLLLYKLPKWNNIHTQTNHTSEPCYTNWIHTPKAHFVLVWGLEMAQSY